MTNAISLKSHDLCSLGVCFVRSSWISSGWLTCAQRIGPKRKNAMSPCSRATRVQKPSGSRRKSGRLPSSGIPLGPGLSLISMWVSLCGVDRRRSSKVTAFHTTALCYPRAVAPFRGRFLGLALALTCVPLCCGCGSDESVAPPSTGIRVAPDAGGRFDIEGTGGTLLRGAWAEVLIDDGGKQRTLSTRDCQASWKRLDTSPKPGGYFDALRGHELDCEIDQVALALRLYADPVHDTALAMLDVTNHRGATLTVLRFTPVISSGEGGGLFVGDDAMRTRVLDDGSDIVADTEANLHYPDQTSRQPIIDSFFKFSARGDVLSNWNHAVVDLDSGSSWVAGSLGVERAFPTFGTTLDPDAPARDGKRTGQNELVMPIGRSSTRASRSSRAPRCRARSCT